MIAPVPQPALPRRRPLDEPNLDRASTTPSPSPDPVEPTDETPTPAPEPPGLREQLGRTIAAVKQLVGAHIELAKAELGDVMEEVQRVAVLAGIAIGALILVGLLLTVGLMLFLGEAIFGSIGWGILHGTLLLAGVAIACALIALGVDAPRIGRSLSVAIVLGVVVGVVLGLGVTNRAWTALGDAVAGNISADIRPLVVAAGTLGLIGAVIGLVAGARGGGGRGAIAGLILGAVVGVGLGALTAIALGPRLGAAVGVTVALTAWLALMGLDVMRRGIDVEALKNRFIPKQTVETTKETIEWVRAQTPLGRKS